MALSRPQGLNGIQTVQPAECVVVVVTLLPPWGVESERLDSNFCQDVEKCDCILWYCDTFSLTICGWKNPVSQRMPLSQRMSHVSCRPFKAPWKTFRRQGNENSFASSSHGSDLWTEQSFVFQRYFILLLHSIYFMYIPFQGSLMKGFPNRNLLGLLSKNLQIVNLQTDPSADFCGTVELLEVFLPGSQRLAFDEFLGSQLRLWSREVVKEGELSWGRGIAWVFVEWIQQPHFDRWCKAARKGVN